MPLAAFRTFLQDARSAAGQSLLFFVVIAFVIVLAIPILQRAGILSDTVAVPPGSGLPDATEFRMVTLLPKDGIPAIFSPGFVSAEEADEEFFEPDDLVIGVEIEGDARAYGIAHLSSHEIVNDVVGGKPIAVTW